MNIFGKRENKHVKEAKGDGGLVNPYSRLGTYKDKRIGTVIKSSQPNETSYELLYDNIPLAKKIVDIYGEEATREFIELNNFNIKEKETFENFINKINIKALVKKACNISRIYGCACAFIVDDTIQERMIDPLKKKTEIKNILLFNNFELSPSTEKELDFENPNFGLPKYYTIQKDRSTSFPIHNSRFIFLQGEEVSKTSFEANNYFNYSVLHKIDQTLKDWQISYDLLPSIIADYRLLTLKMKGMIEMLNDDADINGSCEKASKIIEGKLDDINNKLSSTRIGAIDSEDDLMFLNPETQGLEPLFKYLDRRILVDSGIPHTILFGESPSGSNSTGNSTTQDWYNKIHSYQENKIRPFLNKIFKLVATYNNIQDIDFEFRSLWQQTNKEIAETRKITADADSIYIDNGVLTSDEIRKSRFGGVKYSADTTIESESSNIENEKAN